MNKLIKTTPVDGTVITKDNCREGIDMIWHIQNIEKMIDSSCEYMKFKKIVDTEIILMFPVSEIDIIRHTIIKHVFNGENMTYKKIADDILDELYKGEISYLSFNDKRSYTRVREAIEYINSSTSRNHSDFYNNETFPLVNEHLTIQQVDANWLKKAINSIYGVMESGEDEVCDEYNAYMLFWIKYCKYRGIRFF